ncbi:tetratricopeptide repeat protein [Candidatus Venteria ishoeyi]|uniref:CHAT domain-containing tetratricopeptide repeat protein n=1 Tax=Candidatus Venteria ishoeyi TaxID=1899563 RepID=UPI0025A5D292|nr:tetratricopeptide repeat protein [Candidatus Venteria ishoeyi]MDM8546576.1 tetratricopeptide repeat protein [Candidatus Venteria ishoeyi]
MKPLLSFILIFLLLYTANPLLAQDNKQELLQQAQSLNQQLVKAYQQGKYKKAITAGKQALKIRQQVLGEHPDTATSLNNLALLYKAMGDYARAEPLYKQALQIKKITLAENHPSTATSLNNLALLYKTMGDYARAESLYKQALQIDKTALGENHPDYATNLNNLALLYKTMGDYARAAPFYKQALQIKKTALGENHPRYATSLNNLAVLYQAMGDYARAVPLYKQALQIDKTALGENHPGYATDLNNLALLYKTMGDYARAEPLYKQALQIRKTALGENHPNYACSLNNLAVLYQAMGDYARAVPLHKQALQIRKTALGENHPDYAQSLNNLAELYRIMGDYARAEPFYQQAQLLLQKTLGNSHPDTALALMNYALLLQKSNPQAAIFFAKRAINTLQASRQQNLKLSEDLKKSFIQSQENKYRTLANWLMDTGRLPEAEQVLALLKEKEAFNYVRRDHSRAANFSHAINCSSAEQSWCQRYQQISEKLTTLGQEYVRLEKKGGQRSATEEKRFIQLGQDLDVADAAYYHLIDQLKQAFAEQDKQLKRLNMAQLDNEPDNFQEVLLELGKQLGGKAVALHFWLTENRLNIIMATENNRVAKVITVDSQDLRHKIMDYRQKLKNYKNVRAESQYLYQQILQPIAKDLRQVKADYLMLSLDDVLRYVPIAALHDGKQYFAEQYALSVYTAATGVGLHLTNKPQAQWHVAGMGVSQGATAVENNNERLDFSALPAVAKELGDIIRENNKDAGILSGNVWLDEKFTLKTLQNTLGERKHQVLHLATHFHLRPGNESHSFLLLGNGHTLNLGELNQRRYRFRGIDLLTLSACNTAMGSIKSGADGSEVESFGTIAQKKGAKAVLATLWQVNDDSTSRWMQHFYQLREQQGLSKIAALRQTQLAFIQGRIKAKNGQAKGGQKGLPYDHPYHWAAFILMGNLL